MLLTCPAGPATQPIWLNNVLCLGDEQKLDSCKHEAMGSGSCPGHTSDIGVACGATGEPALPLRVAGVGCMQGMVCMCPCPFCLCHGLFAHACVRPPAVELRLTNGTNANSGRLELAVNGLWGTVVASKQFDSAAATVVCRQLRLPTPGRTLPGGHFGPGPANGPLWLRFIFCTGNEASLLECRTGLDAGLLWGVAPQDGYDRTTAVALACGS